MISLKEFAQRIRQKIEKLPSDSYGSDEQLSREFFELSEADPLLPRTLRDFCLDLSLRARGIETGPLGLKNKKELLQEFLNRMNALGRQKRDRR